MKEVIHPRQTVASAFDQLSLYLDLVNESIDSSTIPEEDPLLDFPVVQPLDDSVVISTESDLVSAIDNQYWSLIATQPIEEEVPSKSPGPLLSAVVGGEGKPYLVRRLLKAGYSPDLVDPVSGWPIFLIAVYLGRMHAVQAFLEAGAQPNASLTSGGKNKTALGVAIATGNVDMANLLLLNGANFYKVKLPSLFPFVPKTY